MNEFSSSNGLEERQLLKIRELETACRKNEKLCMKLNYDMLEERTADERNDFFCCKDELLTGYLGLYGFGAHVELTGMVHPEYRRQGIFRTLFQSAKDECIKRGVKRLLLITEKDNAPGLGFCLSTGARYSFSEYRMVFSKKDVQIHSGHGLVIRKAGQEDRAELALLDEICFKRINEDTDTKKEDEKGRNVYIAELEGKVIGKVGIAQEDEAGYVFGFCIDPAFRRRGYGRSLLTYVMSMLISDGFSTIILEVETENENALYLYESCGFQRATVYDYYELMI
ncbi:MAG: Acetyltransferase YpeA [Firmicutes bacterium ADurb.Bin182]|nr:MAG: Acetyltransferase YpeA [Firmicutes bacterium ADurb.Bin182]